MKWVRRFALGLAVIATAIAAAFYVLTSTQSGLRIVIAGMERFGGGVFSASTANGALRDELDLRDVLIATPDGMRIHADRVRLRWFPLELARRRLHIASSEIDALTITLPSAATGPSKTVLPVRLPIDVVIDALQLRGLAISESKRTLFNLDSADLVGRWLGERIEIDSLKTTLPETGAVVLNAQARMAQDRVLLEQIHLAIDGGSVDMNGTLGVDRVPSNFHVRWRDMHWPLMQTQPEQAPVTDLRGEAQLSGLLNRYTFELNANALLHGLAAQVAARGSGGLDAVHIDTLTLHESQATARVSGDIAWSPQIRANLDVSTKHFDPALLAADWRGDINARASTQTTFADGQPRIVFTADIANSTLRGYPLSLKARGHGDLNGAHIDEATLQIAQGKVVAQGTVVWSPVLTIDADLLLSQLDPAAFAPRWGGNLNGSAHLRTTHSGDTSVGLPDIAFEVQLAQSKLRDYPLTLSSQGDVREGTVTLQKLTLTSGTTKLSASGRVTPPFAAEAHLDSPDLAALYPGLSGTLAFDMTLSGERDNPHLLTHGTAANLHYLDYRIGKAAWNGDVQPRSPSRVELTADDASVGLRIGHAKLGIDGTEVYHHAQLDAATERGDVNITFQGGYDRKREEWGGQLVALRIAPLQLAAWLLEKPAGLLLGAQRRSLEPACLANDGGRACFNMQRAVLNPGLLFGWSLQAVKLDGFKPLLPPQIDVAGQVNGSGEFHWVDGNVSDAKADLRLSDAHFRTADAPSLDIDPATLHVDEDHDRLHAVLDVHSPRGTVSADVTAEPAPQMADRALTGQLQVEVPDLAFVRPFIRELRSIGGHIEGKLNFAGTIAQPRLAGDMALKDGTARLATPGIEITDIDVSVAGNGDGPLAVKGTMHSGGGTLNLAGTVDPAQVPPRVDLNLNGDSFQAVATRDARIWVSPALRLTSDADGVKLNGALIVPKADITPEGFEGGVSTSGDQIIVGEDQKKPASKLKMSSIVAFQLGDAVRFKGFGLTTRLEGTVVVFDEPPRDTRAQGLVRLVDGQYKAYGQDLRIDTGQLIFSGGTVTTPAVDLYATRHPRDDITVGVRVRGTLDKPMLTLDSDPAMAREQQLSWLLLGRPLDQNSTADRSLVSGAALSLGLTGGDYLAQQLGKRVGIDEVSVGAAPAGGSDVAADPTLIAGSQAAQTPGGTPVGSQTAQLTLGKYLTPRLFVSYGVSLFQPGQTFRLLYDLGHGFKVQTEAGVASGGDVIYTIERGH